MADALDEGIARPFGVAARGASARRFISSTTLLSAGSFPITVPATATRATGFVRGSGAGGSTGATNGGGGGAEEFFDFDVQPGTVVTMNVAVGGANNAPGNPSSVTYAGKSRVSARGGQIPAGGQATPSGRSGLNGANDTGNGGASGAFLLPGTGGVNGSFAGSYGGGGYGAGSAGPGGDGIALIIFLGA